MFVYNQQILSFKANQLITKYHLASNKKCQIQFHTLLLIT